MNDIFLGVFHIIPTKLAEPFWREMRKALESLLALGCIDDDQMLLFMASRQNPSLFEIHESDWFLALKECGAPHLTLRQKKKRRRTLQGGLIFAYAAMKFAWKSVLRFYQNPPF